MTIKRETLTGTLNWGEVFCAPDWKQQPGCHKDGKTLAQIIHNLGEESNVPLTPDELETLEAIALLHDSQHPDHLIRLIVCEAK